MSRHPSGAEVTQHKLRPFHWSTTVETDHVSYMFVTWTSKGGHRLVHEALVRGPINPKLNSWD